MREAELSSLLAEHARRLAVPGAAIGVLDGDGITVAVTGVADAETRAPVTARTRFALGSLCKPMVATVVAFLVRQGRLSLDEPVAALVPELRDAPWAARASVRDLLANCSRVPLFARLEFEPYPDDDDGVLSRFVAELATGDEAAPYWSYSNLGWCVLGRVVECVTGGPWERAMQDELLGPLGMNETAFDVGDGAPRASGHHIHDGGAVPGPPWTPRSLAPAGGTVVSTAADLLRFAKAHLDREELAWLQTPRADVAIPCWLDAWCSGWASFDWPGGPVVGWDGLTPGQRAVLRLVPARRGAVALLTNSDAGRALYRSLLPQVMDACFGVRMPQPTLDPVAGSAGDLGRFAGIYAWSDRRWEVSSDAEALTLHGDEGTLHGRPIDARTFVVDAGDPDTPTMTFDAFDADGRPGVLYEMIWALPRCTST